MHNRELRSKVEMVRETPTFLPETWEYDQSLLSVKSLTLE